MSEASLQKKLFTSGVLIDLDVKRWRGAESLEAKDLGLTDEKVHEQFRLGRRQLLPSEAFRVFERIDRKARKAIEERSHAFPMVRGRYVTHRAVDELLAILGERKSEYEQAAQRFEQEYGSLVEGMIPEIEQAARLAAATAGVAPEDLDVFIEDYTRRSRAAYPSAGEVRKLFKFDWVLFTAEEPTFQNLTDGEARAEAKATLKAEEIYRKRFHDRIESFIEDAAAKVREGVAELARKATAYLESERAIPARNLARFREKIEILRQVNFIADPEVETTLTRLGSVVDAIAGEEQGTAGKAGLTDLLKGIEASMTDLEKISRVTGAYKYIVDIEEPPGGAADDPVVGENESDARDGTRGGANDPVVIPPLVTSGGMNTQAAHEVAEEAA